MKGKKVPGRPRTMMLDCMKNKDRGYKEVEEKAKNREEWHHWNPDLPEQAENQRRFIALNVATSFEEKDI